ncbi:MAG: hypothetical protein CMI56_00865 [Parcubacteria group bacterium]|nr:hypothetical protein [Parcubacteria group bacterium]|tara:strand:+ start:2823 stop:3167 length:345 start_codon:yes stop_codon:yes gene_type:complete
MSKSKSEKAVQYEVSLSIDIDIVDEYMAWLVPHMKEMLKIDGFLSASLCHVELLPSGEDDNKKHFCALYIVKNRSLLQNYFDHHAAKLRGDGVNKFKGKFSATRRITYLHKEIQ